MKRILIAAVLYSTTVEAQPTRDAEYFCVEEISGGIAYDASDKKWAGTRLGTDGKFSLSIQHERTTTKKNLSGTGEEVEDYLVSITPTHTLQAATCFKNNRSNPIFKTDEFRCQTFQADYIFNLKSNRFLLAYLVGYVSGNDDKKTPHIAAGTCTKTK